MAHADKMPGGYVVRGRSRRGVQGRNYMPVLNRGRPPTSSNTSPVSRAVAYRPTARLRKVQIWNSAAGASQMLRRYQFSRSTRLLHSQTVSHHKSEGGWRRLLLFLRASGQRRNWCQAHSRRLARMNTHRMAGRMPRRRRRRRGLDRLDGAPERGFEPLCHLGEIGFGALARQRCRRHAFGLRWWRNLEYRLVGRRRRWRMEYGYRRRAHGFTDRGRRWQIGVGRLGTASIHPRTKGTARRRADNSCA
jgi:hypothetical protein